MTTTPDPTAAEHRAMLLNTNWSHYSAPSLAKALDAYAKAIRAEERKEWQAIVKGWEMLVGMLRDNLAKERKQATQREAEVAALVAWRNAVIENVLQSITLIECHCDEAYTARGRHVPNEFHSDYEDVIEAAKEALAAPFLTKEAHGE